MNEANAKDSPYMLIPEITAGIFAAIAIVTALGGIAATAFIEEGIAAFFLAILAALVSIVAALAVVLAVIIIAIFTSLNQVRVYSISLCALFLAVTLLINTAAFGWFFYDPDKRAEYRAYKKDYGEGIGSLLDDQLDDQTESGVTEQDYFTWRMGSNWDYGYEYSYVYGSKNGVPLSISATRYEFEDWTIQLYPTVSVPELSDELSGAYIEEWRVSGARLEYYDSYDGVWYDLGSRDPYFNNAGRVKALNELVNDEDIDLYMNWGTPQITYYPSDSDIGTSTERRRLARYIELITELYPPEGTWDSEACTPYG